jgi:methylphosphotriester-DNA--protein-cysteine methyltransferase
MASKESVFANKATKVFHRSDKPKDACRASEIKPSNRVKFENAEAAQKAGYINYQLCYPNEFWY